MRFPVAKVFLALLFTMIFGASVLTGSKAMAQAGPQVTGTSQTDRIAALEKQAADNAAAIAAAQTA
ncbi:MAG: Ammonium transporter, partial [Edaphobacter sp.]|nr:Ammonium transporter [Edaphobacter sp.]